MERVVAVVNAACGRGARFRVRLLAELGHRFPGLAIRTTGAAGQAVELAREAAGADLVIAVGGDGTVREVASGLVGAGGDRAALAIVPAGSGNDFARGMRIPLDALEACHIARDGRPRAIDVGRVVVEGGRDGERVEHFVNVAGFGFDAQVAALAARGGARLLRGLPRYLVAVVRALASYRCPAVRMTIGEGAAPPIEKRVLFIAAANGTTFGGGMKVAPEAQADDGLLDVCVVGAAGRLTIVRHLLKLLRGTHGRLEEVSFSRVRSFEIEPLDPLLIELDGDPVPCAGVRRFRVDVLPGALRVMVP